MDSPDIETSPDEKIKDEKQLPNIKIDVHEENNESSVINDSKEIEKLSESENRPKEETKKVTEMSNSMNELYKKFEKTSEDKQKLTP